MQKDLGICKDPLFDKIYFIIWTNGLIIILFIMPFQMTNSPFESGDGEKGTQLLHTASVNPIGQLKLGWHQERQKPSTDFYLR